MPESGINFTRPPSFSLPFSRITDVSLRRTVGLVAFSWQHPRLPLNKWLACVRLCRSPLARKRYDRGAANELNIRFITAYISLIFVLF